MKHSLLQILKARWLKQRLMVDFILAPSWLHTSQLIRKESFTDRPAADLHAVGYRRCRGLYDSILWWGIPVYIRIQNGKVFDVSKIPSKDTAATLNDAMTSNATTDFIKGMSKGQIPAMDMQKLLLIGGIAVAAIIGTKVIGLW